jgi:hypothetical protein
MSEPQLEGVRKARARYLRYGVPRRWKVHKGPLAAAYRNHFIALRESYGPFETELVRQAAADAAEAFVRKCAASRAWQEAQEKRDVGTGRRPNQALVIRLAKRCALDASTYDLAVNRLRALTERKDGRPHSVADLFAEAPHV